MEKQDEQILQNSNINENQESGITMVDVLQEEEDLEDDAEAVLGAGDDTLCTYDQGYMKRQPLYACLTCNPTDKATTGGICLGCSYHCHEDHELVELYTKRNFRCDCGNSKYCDKNPCKLIKDKLPGNVENKYNHNFVGKYCTCNRPYPDPEDHIEDQMIQCIICEDWYHGRHLNVEILPAEDDFSEMICGSCVPKLSFINYYIGLSVNPVKKDECSDESTVKEKVELDIVESDLKMEENKLPEPTKDFANSSTSNGDVAKSSAICKIKDQKELSHIGGAIFFSENWRKNLCTCSSCIKLYSELRVSYLIDIEDTVSYYELQGRSKRQSQRGVQRELDALSSLDRITRTEVVHEYNNLSVSLREYLKKFAENGKVVKDEDIREFFSNLAANKKQKREGMQYFCK